MPRNDDVRKDWRLPAAGGDVFPRVARAVRAVMDGLSVSAGIESGMENAEGMVPRRIFISLLHAVIKHHELIHSLVLARSAEMGEENAGSLQHETRMACVAHVLLPLLEGDTPFFHENIMLDVVQSRIDDFLTSGIIPTEHAFLRGLSSTIARHERLILRKGLPADPRVMATAHSHPLFLVDKLSALVDPDRLARIMEAHLAGERFFVRTRPGARERVARLLARKGFTFQADATLPDLLHVLAMPGWKRGLLGTPRGHEFFLVQDLGSAAVVEALGVVRGDLVLDACAAPLQKTIALSWKAGVTGRVVAVDVHPARLVENVKRLRRAAGSPVDVIAGDATRMKATLHGLVPDRVLVDVPCTGSGSMAAHPELRWMQTRNHLDAHVRLQRSIVASCLGAAKRGEWHDTRFVYSTCSYYPEEGEGIIDAFLDEIALVDLHAAGAPLASFPTGWKGHACARFAARTFPDVNEGARGFFIAAFTVKP